MKKKIFPAGIYFLKVTSIKGETHQRQGWL